MGPDQPADHAETPAADALPVPPRAPDAHTGDEPGADAAAPEPELSDRDRAVLALERQGWTGGGAKERVIRERLAISPTRYYQLLNALLDDPRALRHDPVTVNRLRRVRAERRARR